VRGGVHQLRVQDSAKYLLALEKAPFDRSMGSPVECAALRPHPKISLNTMYAVIATGGKQYRVTKDGVLKVEKLDAEPGATVEFGEVLLVGEGADVKVGKPTLKGGKVLATVVRHGKGAKVSIVKFKRRAHYLRQKNHRQLFTEVKVTDISAG
jgi:large subunit ribosomal protein L21